MPHLLAKIVILLLPTLVFVQVMRTLYVKYQSYPAIPKNNIQVDATPSPTATPNTPTPTVKPLSFTEMDSIYGPCTKILVIMYHHIQTQGEALKNKESALTTYTPVFETQISHLKENGYHTVTPKELIDFFDGKITIPQKAVMLTFDDGYENLYTQAFPLLKKYELKGIAFIPTGLINNPKYLSWGQIEEMQNAGIIYFANHTWSHKTVSTKENEALSEIKTADTQLKDHSLNSEGVFSYPYGSHNAIAIGILRSLNYKLAFTTNYGIYQCSKQRLALPRVRAGNKTPTQLGI